MGSCFPYGYVYFWDCRRQYLINDKRDMTYVQYILILIIWYLTCRFECYWYMGFFNQLCNYQLTAAGVHKLHGESHIHRKSHFRYMCFILDLVISAISSMYGRTANWEMFERQGNEQGIRDAELSQKHVVWVPNVSHSIVGEIWDQFQTHGKIMCLHYGGRDRSTNRAQDHFISFRAWHNRFQNTIRVRISTKPSETGCTILDWEQNNQLSMCQLCAITAMNTLTGHKIIQDVLSIIGHLYSLQKSRYSVWTSQRIFWKKGGIL